MGISCFFCQKEIEYKTEEVERKFGSHYTEHYEMITIAIPSEQNLVRFQFEFQDMELLEKRISKAEKEVQKIIEEGMEAGYKAMERHNAFLGPDNELTVDEHEGWISNKQSRRGKAINTYRLRRIVGYKMPNEIWEILRVDSFGGNFLAHQNCLKKEITLEEAVNNPLVAKEFKEDLAELSQPMQDIYQKIKNEALVIEAKDYN